MSFLNLNYTIGIVIVLAVTGCTQNQLCNQDYVARYKGVFTMPAREGLINSWRHW